MTGVRAAGRPTGAAERKVTALVTRPGPEGPELLCFDHPSAGVQLPAGTVEAGESFADAARREAWEETGTLGLELVTEVATLRTHTQERRCFHLRATIAMPDSWVVVTPDGGGHAWWCFWAPVPDAYALVHEHQRDWLDAASAELVASARRDQPPRPRPPLPEHLADERAWELFWAPEWPFGAAGRRYLRSWVEDLDDLDRCSRARAVCATERGDVVVVRNEFGFWEIPGGGREAGESVEENLAREVWEEARARVADARFLTALRTVELDRLGGGGAGERYQAYYWARVELEPFVAEFEMVERRALPAREADELLIMPNDHVFALAAAVDPRLDWSPESR